MYSNVYEERPKMPMNSPMTFCSRDALSMYLFKKACNSYRNSCSFWKLDTSTVGTVSSNENDFQDF